MEAITLISHGHVPDDVYEMARRHFTEKELIDLTLAIVAISPLAFAFRTVPGTFQLGVEPSDKRATHASPSTVGDENTW